jgi:uncharacterized protein YneF (UPF0154 family)
MEYTMADDPKVKAALESIKKQYAHKGRTLSEEHVKHMSEALKGRKLSPEHIQHMSEALKGRKLSEETKQKMSEAKKGNKNAKGAKMKPQLNQNEILYCVEAYGKAIRDGMDGVAEKWAQIAHSFVDDLLLKSKTVAKGHIVAAEKLSETRKRGRPRKNVETEQPKKKRHRRTKAEMEAYRASLAAQNQTETN